MDKFNWAKSACALFLLCAATAIALPAQTFEFETMHSFDYADGAWPYVALVQDGDGNLYGTTERGGASSNCPSGCGTVFSLSLIPR